MFSDYSPTLQGHTSSRGPALASRGTRSSPTHTRYGINQKTVAKWKRRSSVADLPSGPRERRSSVLSFEDEAIVVAFRKHTLLLLDDCLYTLQATIPYLTRPHRSVV
jgi:hypothetical protein